MKNFVTKTSGPYTTAVFDLDTFIEGYAICDEPTKICQSLKQICNGK